MHSSSRSTNKHREVVILQGLCLICILHKACSGQSNLQKPLFWYLMCLLGTEHIHPMPFPVLLGNLHTHVLWPTSTGKKEAWKSQVEASLRDLKYQYICKYRLARSPYCLWDLDTVAMSLLPEFRVPWGMACPHGFAGAQALVFLPVTSHSSYLLILSSHFPRFTFLPWFFLFISC